MRPIDEVLQVLAWAREQGALQVTVDDVRVSWRDGAGGGAAGSAPAGGSFGGPAVGGQVVPFRGRGSTEGSSLGAIAKQRSDEERKSGAPEFREPEDILAAEEAAERGQQPPPPDAAGDEE